MAVAAAAVLEWRRKWRNFEVELEIILFIFHGGVRWLSDSVAERERGGGGGGDDGSGVGGGGVFFFFFNLNLNFFEI